MFGEEKNEVADLIAANLEIKDEAQVEDVSAAVLEELTETPAEEAETPAEVVETPAEEVAEEVEEVEQAELSDHDKAVNEEMKSLGIDKEGSQKRFRDLANEARDGREYKKRYEEQQAVFDHMEKSGVTGEQFGVMTAIAADVNSGDPVREERAYKALMAEATALAQKLGIASEGFDPLTAHADLAQRVNDGLLDRADALELARGRSMQTRTAQHRETVAAQDTKQQAINQAANDLRNLEASLQADPQYAAKRAIIEPLLKAQIASGTLAPNQWAPTFSQMYGNLNLPAPTPKPKPIVKAAPDNAGRPNGAAGGVQPKNAAEAVLLSMGLSPE